MGGSKTETYTDLQAQALFAGRNDLMSKEMIRIFAMNKSINSRVFNKSMLLASQKYYAAEKFNALGITSEIVGAVKSITEYGVTSFLSGKFASPTLFYFSANDINGNAIALPALKVREQLNTLYNVDPLYEKIYSYSYTSSVNYNVSNYTTLTGSAGPDTATINIKTNKYEIGVGTWYQLYSDVIVNNNVSMELLDANNLPTGTIIQVPIISDNRTIYICNYSYDNLGVTTLGSGTYFFKSDIVSEVSQWHFLMLPLKDNGAMINNPGYVKTVLSDLGLGNGVLDSSLANNNIKRALISHSTSLNDTNYSSIINEIYGVSGNRKEVTLQTNNYTIHYHNMSMSFNGNTTNTYNVSIDGFDFDVANKSVIMLPMEELRKEPMNIRYKRIQSTLRLWANTSTTVHLKWYQSGFFKFIGIIIAAVISIYTENPKFLMMAIEATAVLGVISAVFGPEVAAIVGIIFVLVTFNFGAATKLETFSVVSGMANQMSQVYFIEENKSISKNLSRINEKDKLVRKAISDMKKQTIYIPFDSYTNYYDGMYSIATEAYSAVYDTVFNFDIMLKPKLGVRNG